MTSGFEYSVFIERLEDWGTPREYQIYMARFSYAFYGLHMEWRSLNAGSRQVARVSMYARRGICLNYDGRRFISRKKSLEYFSSSDEDMKPFLDFNNIKETK